MTRSELIEAIIAENYRVKGKRVINVWDLPDSRRQKSNKDVLNHYRKELGNTAKLAHLTAMLDQLKKEQGVSEDEDKWLRMKHHIAQGADEKGLTGKRRNAYIYGAMRARGWEPSRERINETMDPASSYSGSALSPEGPIYKGQKQIFDSGLKMFNKDVVIPHRKLTMAFKHYKRAKKEIKKGNPHGHTMLRRATASMKTRGAQEGAAAAGGAFAIIPVIPGAGILGNAALASKATGYTLAKMRARRVLAKAAKR